MSACMSCLPINSSCTLFYFRARLADKRSDLMNRIPLYFHLRHKERRPQQLPPQLPRAMIGGHILPGKLPHTLARWQITTEFGEGLSNSGRVSGGDSDPTAIGENARVRKWGD